MRKIAVSVLLASVCVLPAAHAIAGEETSSCSNGELGDVMVGPIGVDRPGTNGYVVVCFGGPGNDYGIDIDGGPFTGGAGGPICVQLVIDGTQTACIVQA